MKIKFLLLLVGANTIFTSIFAQEKIGVLSNDIMNETSGMSFSHTPGIMAYIHNDSGDTSRFFGIDKKGNLKSILYFQGVYENAGVRDCEDMAIGKSAEGHNRYIYIGDIGDNNARRSFITVYRIPEPASTPDSIAYVKASPLHFTYPDGPRDAETLMIDNIGRLLYIISKREDTVHIYTASLQWKTGDTITLHKRGSLYFEGARRKKWIVSGDVSQDGKTVLLKSLAKVYYWKRKEEEPLWKTLQRKPIELPYKKEPQGEAICFDKNATHYYTISEGKGGTGIQVPDPKLSMQPSSA